MVKRDPLYTTRAWRQLRLRVLARDGYVCQMNLPGCVGNASHVDHIVPRAVDPDLVMTLSNLRAACHVCNEAEGGRLGAERARQSQPTVKANGFGRW